MAKNSELKIYNSALFLLKDLYERIPKFSKQYKYLLGERLLDCNVELIKEISAANRTRQKSVRIEHINKLIIITDEMFLYIRIAEELKQFKSTSAYPYLIEKLADVSRQGTGWSPSCCYKISCEVSILQKKRSQTT